MSVNSEITILLSLSFQTLIYLKKIELYKNFKIVIVDTSPDNHKIEKL